MLSKDEIKERIDLSKVVEGDIGAPVEDSGDWLLYFCPFHTNTRTPALGINTDTNTFKCFSCQVQGDIFAWHMLREKVDFKGALKWYREQLGDAEQFYEEEPKKIPRKAKGDHPPSAPWQQRGQEFIKYAQDQLWQGDAGLQDGLDELFGRGLNAETILTWGLGYNPEWVSDDPRKWGITPKATDHKIWLGRGLVIPAISEDQLWYLKIRLFGVDGKPTKKNGRRGKYLQVAGGKGCLYGVDRLGNKRGLLLAESELDALLAWQIGRDLMDVATLGGAGKNFNQRWIPYLLPYRRIFLAYDQDKAGLDSAQKLASISQRLNVSPPPFGDLIEFQQGGGSVRLFIKGLVSQAFLMEDNLLEKDHSSSNP